MADAEEINLRSDMIFKLSARRSPSEVKLKSLEWAVVTQLNGEKTVAQIGEILALNQEELQEIFGRLLEEGLLELVSSPKSTPFVSPQLIKELEYLYTLYVGPVASVLLDEVLAELKIDRNTLELRYLPYVVERLSLEISDSEKQIRFQREAVDLIKDLNYA